MYLFQDGSFCIFSYFVLSPLVFLINFVTEIIGADGGREEDGADVAICCNITFRFLLDLMKVYNHPIIHSCLYYLDKLECC